jgi:hypothetical protein
LYVVGSKVAEVVVVGGAELEVEGFGVGRRGERVGLLVGEEEERVMRESVKHRGRK